MVFAKKLSYRVRIFLYFLVLVMLVIIAISTVLYWNVKNVMDSETLDTNRNTIVQLKNSTEIMLDTIDHHLNQLAFDYNIQTFNNIYDQATYREIQDVIDKVNMATSANLYMTACYIYYFDNGKILNAMNSRYMDLELFDKKDFIKKVWQLYKQEALLKQFLFYAVDAPDGTDTLTIVKPVNIYSMQPVALLIVTMDPHYFSDLLNSTKINEKASVYITNSEGAVISIKNKQNRNFIEQIGQSNKEMIAQNETGHFTTKIDGTDCLVSFTTSKNFNWKYFYVIPTGEIYKKIEFVKEFVLLLAFLCLVLGTAISLMLSRNLYSPISGLINTIRQNTGSGVKSVGNDIAYIDSNIKDLISHNKGLEESLKESMPIMKNSFLLRILSNEVGNEEPLWDRLRFYSLDISEGRFYAVCIAAVDQYESLNSSYSEKQTGMLEVYQKELVYGVCRVEDGVLVELVKPDANELVMIFSISGADIQEADRKMRAVVAKVHEELARNMKFTLTAGTGAIYEDIQKIHLSYKEARRALAYKVIRGNNAVIFIGEVPKIHNWQYVYPYDIEKGIFNCLKQGDGEGALAALKEYFEYAQNNITESTDVKYAFIHLLDSTVRCLTEMSISAGSIFPDQDSLYKHLTSKETMQDAYEWFTKLYARIIEYINTRRENKSDEIVSRVADYIEKNFSSPDLSLDLISENLHFSSSYLGKLFRESTGKSIKEFIIEKRVEKALQLLEQPDMKIKEVGERVGYPNDRSFINIFKKTIGETPGEYRDHYLKKLI